MNVNKPDADRVMVIGDVHSDFGRLNDLQSRKKAKTILATGDFGYWPFSKTGGNYVDNIRAQNAQIFWCDGNHESHNLLNELEREHGTVPIEVAPSVFYCPRGTTITLEDGRTVLFMGGAMSVDAHLREVYRDWFPQEVIDRSDLDKIPDTKIDIVISHTCPNSFNVEAFMETSLFTSNWVLKRTDPSKHYLDVILDRFRPGLWFFSHYHLGMRGQHQNTKWECLNMFGRSNNWNWLPSIDIK